MEELLQLLNQIHPLSHNLLLHLSSTLQFRELQRKEFLLKAGQISRHVCYVSKGLFRCYYESGEKEVSSWFMKEGDVLFSSESFYTPSPSYESIQALEPCTVYFIDHDQLEYIYHANSKFNYIGRVLTIKYHTLWAQQLYSIRMRSAMERYEWLRSNHPDLLLRVPLKHLASYLDMEVVILSKIRRQI